MPLHWKDAYLLGHPEMDRQHQRLFNHVAYFLEARSPQMQVLCARGLYDETSEHFKFEESLMSGAGYSDVAKHCRDHKMLLAKLDEITHKVSDPRAQISNLSTYITDWL
jgi:hemerythrin-like metal-binding protein